MNRRLQWINLFGVLLLAAFCAFQWRRDRGLNLDLNRSEKNGIAQAAKIKEQEATARGLSDDLAMFKERWEQVQGEARDTRKKLDLAERENQMLKDVREQLEVSVTNWATAVMMRDERIKTANTRIEELANHLNGTIQRLNELTTNYNALVTELNAARAARAAAANATNAAAAR